MINILIGSPANVSNLDSLAWSNKYSVSSTTSKNLSQLKTSLKNTSYRCTQSFNITNNSGTATNRSLDKSTRGYRIPLELT